MLKTLFEALQTFRIIDQDITVQTLAVFCWVADHEGCSLRDIGKAMEMSQPTVSRNIGYLSKYARYGKPGLGLVFSEENLKDRRYKLVGLTLKGQSMAKRLKDILSCSPYQQATNK